MTNENIDQLIEAKGKARLFGYFENQSPEWLEARAGIGGSDVGTILGVNRFKSRNELLYEKRFGAEPLKPNLAMRMGTKFESAIKELWQENNAAWLTVHDTGTWQSVAEPDYKANPDGIIQWEDGQLGILEIKYSQARDLPESWFWQVQWYLETLGLNLGLVVQCAGNQLIEHRIERTPEHSERMLAEVSRFIEEMRKQSGVR